MTATREPEGGRSSKRSHEKQEAARTWLRGTPGGGERLARIFQVGSAARVAELEGELDQLRAKIDALELELAGLRLRSDRSQSVPDGGSNAPLIELQLPRALLPSERDYRLSRCGGFAVYAGARLLGVVAGVRYHSSGDRPDVLEVRGGRLGRRLLLVPVDGIAAIEAEHEVVVVDEDFSPPRAGERLHGRLERLFGRRERR